MTLVSPGCRGQGWSQVESGEKHRTEAEAAVRELFADMPDVIAAAEELSLAMATTHCCTVPGHLATAEHLAQATATGIED